jgi:ketosteroid isomerase-like protein
MPADETNDRVAIDALQRAYADGVTRRDWEAVRALFRPDDTLSLDLGDRPGRDLAGPRAITDFIGPAMERFTFFQFVILNSHVELWPDCDIDAATARMTMCELRVADGARTDSFGRYDDTYARTDDGWRFATRRYRSLARFAGGEVAFLATNDEAANGERTGERP